MNTSQVIQRFWERNDVKGAITALEKMSDHAVCFFIANVTTSNYNLTKQTSI